MNQVPVVHSCADAAGLGGKLVLAVGAFDGFHRGHRDVIQAASRIAEAEGAKLGVLRFDPHPSRILRPDECPPMLYTDAQTDAALAGQGVDLHLRLPFSLELAAVEPEDFVAGMLRDLSGLRAVVAGPNWRFGRKGRGDIDLLRSLLTPANVLLSIQPGIAWKGALVSSTRIRKAIESGRLGDACDMLGHAYVQTGTVRKGKQLGRELGFPTANFVPEQDIQVRGGVVAVQVRIDGDGPWMNGAGYITPELTEVHILDQKLDLYDRRIEVAILDHIRDASPIHDLSELKDQIARDVVAVREVLA